MKENENTIQNVNDISGISSRILQILEERKVSAYKLEKDRSGIKQSQISHLKSGRNKPSDDLIDSFIRYFPDIDEYWLRTGETQEELAKRLGGKSLDKNYPEQKETISELREESVSYGLGKFTLDERRSIVETIKIIAENNSQLIKENIQLGAKNKSLIEENAKLLLMVKTCQENAMLKLRN